MRFGKCSGVVDHTKEEERGAVHHFRPLLGQALQQRTVKDGLLRSSHFSHSCRMFSNQCFQHYIFEQYIHVGMDFTTVFIGFAFQFLRALANGIHVPFKGFKLLVSRP